MTDANPTPEELQAALDVLQAAGYSMPRKSKKREKNRRKPVLTRELFGDLLMELNPKYPAQQRDRALFSLMLEAGLRIGEAAALKLEDIEQREGGVWYVLVLDEGKTEYRPVPVRMFDDAGNPTPLRHEMREWLLMRANTPGHDQGEYLFNTRRGLPVERTAIAQRLQDVREPLGITWKLTSHVFRRTRATELARQGWGPYELCQFFGWSTPDASMEYAQLSVRDIEGKL